MRGEIKHVVRDGFKLAQTVHGLHEKIKQVHHDLRPPAPPVAPKPPTPPEH